MVTLTGALRFFCKYIGKKKHVERGEGITCTNKKRLKIKLDKRQYESIIDKFCISTCFSHYTGHAQSDVDIEPENIFYCRYKKGRD
jgi:hypothetical protein